MLLARASVERGVRSFDARGKFGGGKLKDKTLGIPLNRYTVDRFEVGHIQPPHPSLPPFAQILPSCLRHRAVGCYLGHDITRPTSPFQIAWPVPWMDLQGCSNSKGAAVADGSRAPAAAAPAAAPQLSASEQVLVDRSRLLFERVDANGSGAIDKTEFLRWTTVPGEGTDRVGLRLAIAELRAEDSDDNSRGEHQLHPIASDCMPLPGTLWPTRGVGPRTRPLISLLRTPSTHRHIPGPPSSPPPPSLPAVNMEEWVTAWSRKVAAGGVAAAEDQLTIFEACQTKIEALPVKADPECAAN